VSDRLVVLIGEDGCNLPDDLEHAQDPWGMDIGLDRDRDCLLETLIHLLPPAKVISRPSAAKNARAILNDTLLKRGYAVTILCHGPSQEDSHPPIPASVFTTDTMAARRRAIKAGARPGNQRVCGLGCGKLAPPRGLEPLFQP